MILYDSTNVLYIIMLLKDIGYIKDAFLGQSDSTVKDAFKKFSAENKDSIKGKISGFAGSVVGKAAIGIAMTAAMNEAIQWASDKWDLSYDSAIKNTSESNSGVQTAVSDLDSLISKQEEYKKSLSDIGAKYNVDLTGVDNINAMITKINSQKGISLIDKEEIQKIQTANQSLQASITLKKQAVSSKEEKAAEHAEKSLKRGTASFAQGIETKASKYDSKTYTNNVTPFAHKNVSVTTQVSDDLEMIDKLNNSIEDAKQKQIGAAKDSQQWKKSKKEIKEYTKLIDELKTDMSSRQGDLNDLLSAFSVNGKGEEALAGYESESNKIKSLKKECLNWHSHFLTIFIIYNIKTKLFLSYIITENPVFRSYHTALPGKHNNSASLYTDYSQSLST